MRKNILLLILLLKVCYPFAQSSVELEIGYGRPYSLKNPFNYNFGFAYNGIVMYDDNTKVFQDAQNSLLCLGSGPNISLSYGQFVKKWIRLSLAIYYMNNKHLSYQKDMEDIFEMTNTYSATQFSLYDNNIISYLRWDLQYYLNQFAIFPEVDILKKIKKIEFSLVNRFGISFNTIYFKKSYYEINNKPSYSYKYYENKSKESYSLKKFLYQLGGKIGFSISKNCSLNIGLYYRPFTMIPKKGKLIYSDELTLDYQNQLSQEHKSYDLIFTKDKEELSINEKARYPTKYKNTTISFSVGLRYIFGKKGKAKEEEK